MSRIIGGAQRNNKQDEQRAIRAKDYEDEDEGDEDEEDEDEDLGFDDISSSAESSTPAAYHPWSPVRDRRRRSLEPPLRVCSEAHILISNTIGAMAVLPVLPVADADNIIPLVSSVLYQRRVWGVNLPVVGVCLSRHDTTARIYVGWMDPDALTSAGLVCPSCVLSMPVADFVAFGPRRIPKRTRHGADVDRFV